MTTTYAISPRLYSRPAIYVATFLGGPLAAGFLVGRNFRNLGRPGLGKLTVLLGLLMTIGVMGALVIIPEKYLDYVPAPLIPAAYTMIIAALVSATQGSVLDQHRDSNGSFYSMWRAIAIGLINLGLLLGGLYLWFDHAHGFDVDKYQALCLRFEENEQSALRVYEIGPLGDKEQTAAFIETVGIPKWEENLAIVDEISGMKNLPPQLASIYKKLRLYCERRIEAYRLIKRSLANPSDALSEKIDNAHRVIDGLKKHIGQELMMLE